jgi:hypothetical protein
VNAALHPATGRITEADIDFLFESVHASMPAGTDPAVIRLLDSQLARLIEVGANIAGGDQPLT